MRRKDHGNQSYNKIEAVAIDAGEISIDNNDNRKITDEQIHELQA